MNAWYIAALVVLALGLGAGFHIASRSSAVDDYTAVGAGIFVMGLGMAIAGILAFVGWV